MKLTTTRGALKWGLDAVVKAAAGRTSLPVLKNVLLATDNGRVRLAATDLEIGITAWAPARVQEEGAITLPAVLLAQVVDALPGKGDLPVEVTLNAKTQTATLVCGRFVTNLKGIEADEFPTIPTLPTGATPDATVPAGVLAPLIEQVVFAAAEDDTRPVLAGVRVRITPGQIQLATADGYRMAQRAAAVSGAVAAGDLIVPARAMAEIGRLARAAAADAPVALYRTTGDAQFAARVGDLEVVSRLIGGTYPDVARIIPVARTTRATFDCDKLVAAVKLASFFAGKAQNVLRLVLTPGFDGDPNGTIEVRANTAEVGDNTGAFDALIAGPGGEVAVNVGYLQEALGALPKGATVVLDYESATRPPIIRAKGAGELDLHLIMPMSIR